MSAMQMWSAGRLGGYQRKCKDEYPDRQAVCQALTIRRVPVYPGREKHPNSKHRIHPAEAARVSR